MFPSHFESAVPPSRIAGKLLRWLGVIMIIAALWTLLLSLCAVMPQGYVDFPCLAGPGPRPEVITTTRIAWCISWWPRTAVSGGAVYAVGSTEQDRAAIEPDYAYHYGPLSVERQGDTLVVNGQALTPGATYRTSYSAVTLSLWAYMTAELAVTNKGVVKYAYGMDPKAIQALDLSGDLHEGWAVSPLGPALLIGGILLLAWKPRRLQAAGAG
jgi:hypothetical protein